MDGSSHIITLSIVAPCYNEEEGLEEFCARACEVARIVAGNAFEIVLIDDGSRDNTWQVITAISAKNPYVIGVRLMRNHGHQLAATAGLTASRGDRVMLIDADLQDPPELLIDMMDIMNTGADVVYGQRTQRASETWFKLTTASLFYRLLSHMTAISIPRDTGDFRLMTRRVVNILLTMPERDRFIRGMVSWIGGRQVALPYAREPRFAGATKYPLSKMINFAVDAITSFSTVPLRISTWLGILTAGLAFFLLIYTVWQWASGNVVSGWSSLMVVLCGFSAIQLICLGIMGEYIGRLVQENKKRPMFMIDGTVKNGLYSQTTDGILHLDSSGRITEASRSKRVFMENSQ